MKPEFGIRHQKMEQALKKAVERRKTDGKAKR
jgi:hypothetical protein